MSDTTQMAININATATATAASQRAMLAKENEARALRDAAEARQQLEQQSSSVDGTIVRHLQMTVHELNDKIAEKDAIILEKEKTILRQNDLLKEWMASQIAFKNLFKKYGKMPDGRSADDLSDEEKAKLVQSAVQEARKTLT